jgi:isoquinoline 1-oxidoreductase beta subunit
MIPRRPIKLIWTREDELSSGFFRPMSHHRVLVDVGEDGFPARWRHRTVSQPLLPLGPNAQAVEGVAQSPYLAAAKVIDGKVYSPTFPVPVAFWRSVGHSHNAMVMEHIVDQLARRLDRDPAEYRRALYRRTHAKRHLAVLDELCSRGGWGAAIEYGWARGLAVHECFGTVVGQLAEVRVDAGRPVVRRVVAVVDCGIAISPDQIVAQMEGGIGFGLSAALYGAMTLKNGIVQETNFDSYPVIRMNEMPVVETYILPSTNRPTGMGEPGVPPIAPAIANAMFALTGVPTTSLPILRNGAAASAGFSFPRASA